MKLLLVHPTCERWCGTPIETEPAYAPSFGVNSLATALENKGHDVFVLDELAKWLLDKHNGYLDWTSLTLQLIEDAQYRSAWDYRPDSLPALALQIAKAAKQTDRHPRVVLGGPHATFTHQQLLAAFPNTIDAVVVGEGETAFAALVEAFAEGKPQRVFLAFRPPFDRPPRFR